MSETLIGRLRNKLFVALGCPHPKGFRLLDAEKSGDSTRINEATAAEQIAAWGISRGTDVETPWYAADVFVPYLLDKHSVTRDEIDRASLCELATYIDDPNGLATQPPLADDGVTIIERKEDIPAEYRDHGAMDEKLKNDSGPSANWIAGTIIAEMELQRSRGLRHLQKADKADKKTDSGKKSSPPLRVKQCAGYIVKERKKIEAGKRPKANKRQLIAEFTHRSNNDAMERELQPSRYGYLLEIGSGSDKADTT